MEREEALIQICSAIHIKADPNDENVIYIEASNEREDRQKDTVLQKALEEQANDFLKRGVLSYDHLHKTLKDPRYIIGEPLDVKFDKDGRTLVKGMLYKSNDFAKDLKLKMKDGCTRIGSSIGGYITKRVRSYNKQLNKSINYITGILWDEVALTHKPVNSETLGNVTYVPFAEFAKSFCSEDYQEELFKALMAGGGTDSSTFTGGRATIPESLQGSGKAKMRPNRMRGYLQVLVNGEIKSFKELADIAKSEGDHDLVEPLATLFLANLEKIKLIKRTQCHEDES